MLPRLLVSRLLILLIAASGLLHACVSSKAYLFPSFGYKQFDRFSKGNSAGEIFIQEDHQATEIKSSREFFVFRMLNDSVRNRIPMGALAIGEVYIDQVLDIWAAPLKVSIDGKTIVVKAFTPEADILFESDVYFPKSMEVIIPDSIRTGDEIIWESDPKNKHGIVVEITAVSDTALGIDAVEIENRSYFYLPKDAGNLKISQSIIEALKAVGNPQAILRLYRGTFESFKPAKPFSGKIRFFYWSSCTKIVYPISSNK